MSRVFFTKDINGALSGIDCSKSLVIYHEMYGKPQVEAKQVLEWQKYRGIYSEIEPDNIILIGLNRMINPANRCDFVHDYLTTLTPNIPKIVIDTAPFIGEPWRLFFHYLFSKTNKFGFNYSYPIEGEWKRWFYYETNECRLSADNLKMFIGDTYYDMDKLNTTYELNPIVNEDDEWYDAAKEQVFSKYNSPKLWITNLLKLANVHFKVKLDFESYLTNMHYTVPDLGVYRFVVEENRRRQGIYNVFTKV